MTTGREMWLDLAIVGIMTLFAREQQLWPGCVVAAVAVARFLRGSWSLRRAIAWIGFAVGFWSVAVVTQRIVLLVPDLDIVWALTAPIRWLGHEVGQGDSGVFSVPGYDGRLEVRATPERLGLVVLLAWTVAAWATAPGCWSLRALSKLSAVAASAAILRLALTTGWLCEVPGLLSNSGASELGVVASVWVDAVTIAVVAFAASKLAIGVTGGASERVGGGASLPGLATLLVCGGLAACAAVLCMPAAPTASKDGRILVDDRLAGFWNPAARRMSTAWYGDFSTYNFNLGVRHLARSFAVTVNTSETYTPELLSGFDVLVIKTPVVDLEDAEIEAIRGFVKAGGGLLTIGDHTNLLGMSARLNELLAGTGIAFDFDAVNDGETGGVPLWEAELGRRHPVTAGLESLLVLTPCSLEIRGRARPVLVLHGQESTLGDYGANSYFGTKRSDPQRRFGEMVLCAESRLGAGRVLAVADSTSFSSFHMVNEDWRRLLDNCCEYLNARELAWQETLRVIGFWLCALGLVSLVGTVGATALVRQWLVLVGGVGFVLGAVGANARDEAMQQRETPPDLAIYSGGGGSMIAPVLGFVGKPEWNTLRYESFVTGLMRMGLMPVAADSWERCLAAPSIVVINPARVLPPAERDRLRDHVQRGGRLFLLVDSKRCSGQAVASFSELAGVRFLEQGPSQLRLADDGTCAAIDEFQFNDVSARAWRVGQGSVTIVIGAEHWSLDGLGHAFAIPGRRQRGNLTSLYSVFMKELEGRDAHPNYRIL